MKKNILLLICITFISTALRAQSISTENVPSQVKSSFASRFPNAEKIKWEKEGDQNFEANFYLKTDEYSSTYNSQGQWQETEKNVKESDVPENIIAVVTNQFPDSKIKECSMIENTSHANCYEIEIRQNDESFDLLISTDGKLVAKSKAVED